MKISQDIESLVPYKPGKPIAETQREYGIKNVIKLASNENPLGTSPKVLLALQQAIHQQHRYPDPSCYNLLTTIAKCWNVDKQFLSVGNGSNELIDLLIRIFCEPGDAILTSEKAFIAYQVCAQAARVERFFSPLKENYKIDLSKMAEILRADKKNKIKLVFIPNPNNPTGAYIPFSEIEKFLAEFSTDENRLFIFDEAYNEYARAMDYRSAVLLMKKFSNICILRTLSKAYGLAGLRIGILIAPLFVVELFNKVRNPFNVNDLAQVAAVAALQDAEYIRQAVENNSKGLDFFYQELRTMQLPFVESQANFVMFNTLRDVNRVDELLLKQGIILRPLLNYDLKTEMRMSVGLPHENEAAIFALKKVCKEI